MEAMLRICLFERQSRRRTAGSLHPERYVQYAKEYV
jgi:hypothetical protein